MATSSSVSHNKTSPVDLQKTQFRSLNPVKQAEKVSNMSNEGLMGKQIAQQVGISEAQVSNLLIIDGLPRELKKLIEDEKVTHTLVLAACRQYEDKSYGEIAEILHKLWRLKGAKIHSKDLKRATGRENSHVIIRKFLKTHNRSKIKKNKPFYEFLLGIEKGTIGVAELNQFFGIVEA
jgi:predicted transcriptional regulator